VTSPIEGVPVAWEYRRQLFTLDTRVAYLNHGGFGAVPVPVQRAQQRLRDEMEANPMAFFTRGLLDRVAHTRQHLATFVGADPAGVALVPNATAAANAVLRSLSLGPDDEILLTDHGYGAVRLAAEDVAARVGATVRVVAVPLGADDDDLVSRVVEAVRPRRTRLAIVDQVTSPTATLFPTGRLVAELHRRGVLVAIDAAHAPGMLAVDVSADGADFWLGNLHKWAFAPRPTALLAVAPDHRAQMRPLVVSWEQSLGYPTAQEFAGTLDYTPWLAAPAGLHLLRTLDPQRVRSHNNELAASAQRTVAEAVATRWPAPEASERGREELLDRARAGLLGHDTVSMRLIPLPPGVADEPATAAVLQARLAAEHRIEATITAWSGLGLLRLSAQVYNQIDDYHRLSAALRTLLP
jgi:isopenicillin-N epimerase